jgi:hypothetical protein
MTQMTHEIGTPFWTGDAQNGPKRCVTCLISGNVMRKPRLGGITTGRFRYGSI